MNTAIVTNGQAIESLTVEQKVFYRELFKAGVILFKDNRIYLEAVGLPTLLRAISKAAPNPAAATVAVCSFLWGKITIDYPLSGKFALLFGTREQMADFCLRNYWNNADATNPIAVLYPLAKATVTPKRKAIKQPPLSEEVFL